MQVMQKSTKAFTVVELLISFAIIAIIASAAAPIYANYHTKFKVSKMYAIAQAAQLYVVDDYRNNTTLANIAYANGSKPFITTKEQFITSITITAGVISVVGNATYLGSRAITLTMTPTIQTNSDLNWRCIVNNASYYDFVPTECRQTV
jgi:type IV pilus assembly protein PilA